MRPRPERKRDDIGAGKWNYFLQAFPLHQGTARMKYISLFVLSRHNYFTYQVNQFDFGGVF